MSVKTRLATAASRRHLAAMAQQIPGVAEQLSPLVARVLCDNPSPFTFTGTQTHLVGGASGLAVIDPGPDDRDHLAALLAAIGGRPITAIVITHNHRDHSPLARALKDATGAPIVGCPPLAIVDGGMRADAGFDLDYAPDRVLADGETLNGPGWLLTAIFTPGHTSNHLCFALAEEQALLSGDHVMGWSTTVVSPPDGDMAAYMASLEKLIGRPERRYYPAHGDPVEDPQRLVRGLLGHRRQREGQLLRLLAAANGVLGLGELTARAYVGLNPRLLPAAQRSVLAHLIDLARRGLVVEADGGWAAA